MRRLAIVLLGLALAAPGEVLTGIVVDEAGQPVAGARVRLRAAGPHVTTGDDGRFVLADPGAAPGREITAAKVDHLIGGATVKDGLFEYRLVVRPIPAGDDPTYPWVTAFPEDDRAPRTDFGREPCGACHRRILAEWQQSAHARAAVNPRFLAFLPGATAGSPGDTACGTCHTPMAAADDPDPARVGGVAREGVGCDLCHKSGSAQAADAGRTGVQALGLRRPPFGHQTIFGPFDDVPRGRDVFAPIFSESRFCAACHQLTADGVAIYSEFAEWQQSRYAASGTTCQSCHMRGDRRATTMADLGPGRVERDPATLSSHRFHDSRTPGLLAQAIALSLTARNDGDAVVAEVEIANAGAGHHLPAGSPMRHMLLVVSAEAGGTALSLTEGPTLPAWSGAELDGRPGRVFAKLLRDRDRRLPAPPWRLATLESDTRIPADGRDRSRYRFRLDGTGPVRIDATILIRRTFPAWADAAGVESAEIVAGRESAILRR